MLQLAIREYKTRHDLVGYMAHLELCRKLEFDHPSKWYMHKTKSAWRLRRIKFFGILRYKQITESQPEYHSHLHLSQLSKFSKLMRLERFSKGWKGDVKNSKSGDVSRLSRLLHSVSLAWSRSGAPPGNICFTGLSPLFGASGALIGECRRDQAIFLWRPCSVT